MNLSESDKTPLGREVMAKLGGWFGGGGVTEVKNKCPAPSKPRPHAAHGRKGHSFSSRFVTVTIALVSNEQISCLRRGLPPPTTLIPLWINYLCYSDSGKLIT